MEERKLILSEDEAYLALRIVNYVVYNSTIDGKSDEDGIFLDVNTFSKYISAEDIPALVKMLQRPSAFYGLDKKVLDGITED